MSRSDDRAPQRATESADVRQRGAEPADFLSGPTHSNTKRAGHGMAAIMVVYLLGVFMGSANTGIVVPARTVVQAYFGIDPSLGIWMITIYTLVYAASIPTTGKLADRHGHKPVFIICITLFGVGSLICGLSEHVAFWLLIVGRIVQALGGGGILPIANAEFCTAFPPEKRGMALGLVGGVYGLSNIIGSALGSIIMGVFGTDRWSFTFYFNVPIAIVIIIVGLLCLPDHEKPDVKKTDIAGSLVLVVIIMGIMYGLKNIDFFAFASTFATLDVWPYLLAAVVIWPLFVFVEHRAEDPVLDLGYFYDRDIRLVLIMSILTGIIMMGMIFVPQLAEDKLGVSTGAGGYYVLIIGLASAIAAPLSGKMLDRMGGKPVLAIGFIASAAGCAFLAFVVAPHPGMLVMVVGLIIAGLGIGFVMGTPLNYLMLENTDEADTSSALATLSLVRSVGTVIAPAILVGFLSSGGDAGFTDLYLFVAIASAIGLVLLAFYRGKHAGNTPADIATGEQEQPAKELPHG